VRIGPVRLLSEYLIRIFVSSCGFQAWDDEVPDEVDA
jgi:hypothetical protein